MIIEQNDLIKGDIISNISIQNSRSKHETVGVHFKTRNKYALQCGEMAVYHVWKREACQYHATFHDKYLANKTVNDMFLYLDSLYCLHIT